MWDGNAHLSDDEKALIKAVKETGDAAEVRRLLAAGIGVDIRDGHNMPWDQTPLMLAAHNGFLEIVQLLLAAGASLSAVDKNAGESEGEHQPLHHAVLGQNRAVVEALLDAGADVNALTNDGNTPLIMAIQRGNLDLMRLLVERGAAVTKFSRKRFRPPLRAVSDYSLPWAVKPAIVAFLLQAGADPNATGSRGESTLKGLAAGHDIDDENRLACLSGLLKAGATDLPDKSGGTALLLAIHFGNAQAATLLIEGGSDINHVGNRGTALDCACEEVALIQRRLNDNELPDWQERLEHQLHALQALVELLKARGGKRQSELSSAGDTGAGESTPPAQGRANTVPQAKQPPLGAKHFLKLANDGEPDWALFAVETPREQVTNFLVERYTSAKVQRDVELKKARKNDELAQRVAVVQIRDNPWTIVLRALYHVDESQINAVTDDAQALSRQLQTKAISFVADGTSGAVQYDLFENGALLERAQWADGGAFSLFESTRRRQPKVAEVDGKFADKTFRDLGIYLPACYPRGSQRSACLCVEKASVERVEKADLLELK